MPYVVKLIKAGKVHGMMGPYTTLKTAKRDAQMLADGAEKGVKVYVEQDVPSYLGGTGEGPHYKAKRSTSTKRNPHLKPGDRVKVDGYTGTVVRDLGGDQYEVRMPGGLAVKSLAGVPPIRGGRAKGAAKRNPDEAAPSCSRPDGSFLPVPQCRPGPQPVPPASLVIDGKTWTLREQAGTAAQAKAQAKALRSKGYQTHIEVRDAGIGIYSRGRAKGGKASPTVSSPVTAKKRRSVAARKGAAKRKNPDTDVVSDMGDVYVERDRIDGTYSVVVYDGSRYLVASEWTREAPAIKDAKAWRSMPIRGRRASIAASYKRNPSRKQMENAIAGKMPPGSKKGRGASRVIMLTGDSAKVLGVKNYTKLLMASLTDDQVDTLHNFLVLRMPIASSNRRNPSAGSKWALSKTVGFDDVVLSLHKTRDAAQKVYDKKYDHGMMGPTVRILEVGPNAPSEIIKVFGKRVIRPRT